MFALLPRRSCKKIPCNDLPHFWGLKRESRTGGSFAKNKTARVENVLTIPSCAVVMAVTVHQCNVDDATSQSATGWRVVAVAVGLVGHTPIQNGYGNGDLAEFRGINHACGQKIRWT